MPKKDATVHAPAGGESASEAPNSLAEMIQNMSHDQLIAMATLFGEEAAKARQEKRGREVPKDKWGGHRDAVVQRIAADKLKELLSPTKYGGKGMSLREVASVYGVTYERVRTLVKRLFDEDEYERILGERRTSDRPA